MVKVKLYKTKKSQKLRGGRTHGYGRVGQHRKHPGGSGKCGGMAHMKSYFNKYHPDFFGKRGPRCLKYLGNNHLKREVHAGTLWHFVSKQEKEMCAQNASLVPVIDLTHHGIAKVISGGSLPKRPIVVRARSFTAEAEKMIHSVGGSCELAA